MIDLNRVIKQEGLGEDMSYGCGAWSTVDLWFNAIWYHFNVGKKISMGVG